MKFPLFEGGDIGNVELKPFTIRSFFGKSSMPASFDSSGVVRSDCWQKAFALELARRSVTPIVEFHSKYGRASAEYDLTWYWAAMFGKSHSKKAWVPAFAGMSGFENEEI